MNILALETTEKFGSVALLSGSQLIAEIVLPKDRRSSQTLHPAMQTLFEKAQILPADVALVAVVAGPGSFTGLRVGITAAKVFAYTVGAKILGLDTFQTVAVAMPTHPRVFSIGIDAQRGEVVASVLKQTTERNCETIQEPVLMPVADWWKHADQYENVLFSGPALERWGTKVPPHIVLAEESYWFPKASTAGRLAAKRSASELHDDMWSLLPIYSRLSTAEEKRNTETGVC